MYIINVDMNVCVCLLSFNPKTSYYVNLYGQLMVEPLNGLDIYKIYIYRYTFLSQPNRQVSCIFPKVNDTIGWGCFNGLEMIGASMGQILGPLRSHQVSRPERWQFMERQFQEPESIGSGRTGRNSCDRTDTSIDFIAVSL